MIRATSWITKAGGYTRVAAQGGLDVLIYGTSKYLNFGITSGASGYGIRDNGGVMQFKNAAGTWTDFGAGDGVTDHGALTGLGDDDHPQYHNDARGDLRYSQLGHTHTASQVTDFNTATDARVTAGIATHVGLSDPHTQYQKESEKGAAGGYAELDGTGRVPSAQLPAGIDDVLEYANFASLPVTGASGLIYVTLDDNKTYRWSGSAYVEISASLALGETSATAYRGDRGKTAYDYSQIGHLPLVGGTLSGDLSVPDEAYDATAWNGSMEVPTKNALRDKFETLGVGVTLAEVEEIAFINAVMF